MIDGILICVACAQRFRSNDPAHALARRCPCGGQLFFDQRATLHDLCRTSQLPLEILIERVRAITGELWDLQAESPPRQS